MFDTLNISRKLTAAGFDLKQADVLVESLSHAVNDTVATKIDVAELKSDVAELRSDVAKVEASITIMQGDIARLSETSATKSELNDVRIEARQLADQLRIQIAGLDSKIESEIAELKVEMAALDSKIESEVAGLRIEMAGLRVEMAGLKVEMVQGFEEISKRLMRTVAGLAVILGVVITLVQLLF